MENSYNNTVSNNSGGLLCVYGLIVGLIVGFFGGYYYFAMKTIANPDLNKPQSTTVSTTTNPYTNVDTNPYNRVKINPFQ